MSKRSPEQVATLLADAWAAVEGAGLPEHVQGTALQIAAAHLNDDASQAPTPGKSSGSGTPESSAAEVHIDVPTPSDGAIDEDTFFTVMAAESGLNDEQLHRLYAVTSGQIQIVVRRPDLGSSGSSKMRTIAMLLLGARYLSDGGKDLSVAEVRDEAKRLRLTPDRNLAKYLGKVSGTTMTANGLRVVESKFPAAFLECALSILGDED